MFGAIIGDVVGSVWQFKSNKKEDFKLFCEYCQITDDSVMTTATADAILNASDFGEAYYTWGNEYRFAGYGDTFI